MMALPAGPLSGDASTHRKFYTLTASLREIYDDNINTTSGNKQSSLETQLTPSVLVDFPMENSDFSARYSLGVTYYGNSSNNSGGNGGSTSTIEYTNEFTAQYNHAFSGRFNLGLADLFRNYTEPSLFESTGTNYRNGAYNSNTFNGSFGAQMTPLLGSSTSYSNTIVKYDNAAVALDQNSMENTGTESVSFAVLPKISLSLGGTGDNISYDSGVRGYTSYTGFIGIQWQALPSVSVSGQGGGSYTETVQNQTSIAPYAALSLGWTLGARSSLSFSYAHEVTPSDQIGANGQTSDRLSANLRYDITTSLSSHLQGIFTNANISQQLATAGGSSGYSEYDYALDTGLTYHYNTFLDLDFGITLSGVTSDISALSYTRDETYVGVRGTY